MKEESKLWSHLLAPALKKINNLHAERVENTLGVGTPDVMICYKKKTIFCELKIARNKTIKMEAGQGLWHREHGKAGGKCWILWREDDRVGAFTFAGLPLSMIQAKAIKIDEAIEKSKMAVEITKPFACKWERFIEILGEDY